MAIVRPLAQRIYSAPIVAFSSLGPIALPPLKRRMFGTDGSGDESRVLPANKWSAALGAPTFGALPLNVDLITLQANLACCLSKSQCDLASIIFRHGQTSRQGQRSFASRINSLLARYAVPRDVVMTQILFRMPSYPSLRMFR